MSESLASQPRPAHTLLGTVGSLALDQLRSSRSLLQPNYSCSQVLCVKKSQCLQSKWVTLKMWHWTSCCWGPIVLSSCGVEGGEFSPHSCGVVAATAWFSNSGWHRTNVQAWGYGAAVCLGSLSAPQPCPAGVFLQVQMPELPWQGGAHPCSGPHRPPLPSKLTPCP